MHDQAINKLAASYMLDDKQFPAMVAPIAGGRRGGCKSCAKTEKSQQGGKSKKSKAKTQAKKKGSSKKN